MWGLKKPPLPEEHDGKSLRFWAQGRVYSRVSCVGGIVHEGVAHLQGMDLKAKCEVPIYIYIYISTYAEILPRSAAWIPQFDSLPLLR